MHSFLEEPRYTLEGCIKRILFEASHPMPEKDLLEETRNRLGVEEGEPDELSARIQKALTRSNAPFHLESNGWILKNTAESPLNDRAVEALVLASAPQSYGRILEYIGLTTKRSRGDLMSHIDLDSDARFCRLEDGQWVLTEWMLDQKGFPVPLTELPYDPIQAKSKEEVKSMEITNLNKSLLGQILQEMNGYIEQLEKRQSEIPASVVELFEQENLAAIELLMRERKELVNFQNDLKKLVEQYSAQETLFRV